MNVWQRPEWEMVSTIRDNEAMQVHSRERVRVGCVGMCVEGSITNPG